MNTNSKTLQDLSIFHLYFHQGSAENTILRLSLKLVALHKWFPSVKFALISSSTSFENFFKNSTGSVSRGISKVNQFSENCSRIVYEDSSIDLFNQCTFHRLPLDFFKIPFRLLSIFQTYICKDISRNCLRGSSRAS